jgi:hypothetical protein
VKRMKEIYTQVYVSLHKYPESLRLLSLAELEVNE